MKDANKLPQSVLSQANPPAEPVAMPGDMLQIIISSRNPEAVKPYNKSSYLSDLGSSTTSGSSENSLEYYLVDGSGNIEFPVIGSINILGKNKAEIKEKECSSKTVRVEHHVLYVRGAMDDHEEVSCDDGTVVVCLKVAWNSNEREALFQQRKLFVRVSFPNQHLN